MKYICIGLLLSVVNSVSAQSKIFVNGGTTGIGVSGNSYVGIGPSNVSPLTHLHILDSFDGELSLLLQNTNGIGARTFLTSMPSRSLLQTDRDFGISTNGGGWSEKFTVLNNGKVGIGTTTPDGKLDIAAGSAYPIRTSSSQRYILEIRNSNDASGGWWLTNDVNGNFAIHKNAQGDKLTLTSDGNLGIGTSSPNQKLTVNGTIYGKEVKVDLSVPGPDYVFEKSYTLPSLDQVKSYVEENKHLPEVPSAAEMEKNGINVSEMNMLLLKKVEELTLYAIEQQRMLIQQGEMIESQNIKLEQMNQRLSEIKK